MRGEVSDVQGRLDCFRGSIWTMKNSWLVQLSKSHHVSGACQPTVTCWTHVACRKERDIRRISGEMSTPGTFGPNEGLASFRLKRNLRESSVGRTIAVMESIVRGFSGRWGPWLCAGFAKSCLKAVCSARGLTILAFKGSLVFLYGWCYKIPQGPIVSGFSPPRLLKP